MSNQPRFAIFYADPKNDVIDDGEDVLVTFRVPRAWLDAPKTGVQAVVTLNEGGKMAVHRGSDFYMVMPNGDRIHTNDPGAQLLYTGLAKYGTWIPDNLFREAQERAGRWRSEQMEKK